MSNTKSANASGSMRLLILILLIPPCRISIPVERCLGGGGY